MKYASTRPFADPEAAARKLLEIANATEAVQDGRIYIETINGRMLFVEKASPAEYSWSRPGGCPRKPAACASTRAIARAMPSRRTMMRW